MKLNPHFVGHNKPHVSFVY